MYGLSLVRSLTLLPHTTNALFSHSFTSHYGMPDQGVEGHKRECALRQGASMAAQHPQGSGAVQQAVRTRTEITADQFRVLAKLYALNALGDSRGLVAMEREFREVAAVRAEAYIYACVTLQRVSVAGELSEGDRVTLAASGACKRGGRPGGGG